MFTFRNGKSDAHIRRIKDEKEVEMELRRMAMEKRCEKKRSLRDFYVKRRQDLEAAKTPDAQKDTDERLKQIEQSYRLAEELSRRKRAEIRKSAKSCKPQAPTGSSSDESKPRSNLIEEKLRRESENMKLINDWYRGEPSATKRSEEARRKKEDYRAALQNQLMTLDFRAKKEKEEEMLRDKKMLEDAAKAAYKEEAEAEKQRRRTALLLKSEAKSFTEARQIWKEKIKQALKQEQESIDRIAAEKVTAEKHAAQKKDDVSAMRNRVMDALARKLTDEEFWRTEREEICHQLRVAELEEEHLNEKIRADLRKSRVAKELSIEMVRQQKASAERKAKEMVIDAAFARFLAEQQRTLEEKEKEKEEKRRERDAKHGEELRNAIIENRVRYAMEIARNNRDARLELGDAINPNKF